MTNPDEASVDELVRLAERCEQATGPDRELDWHLFSALGHTPYRMGMMTMWRDALGYEFPATSDSVPKYTASLDAAMTLIPEGWWWRLGNDTDFAWASAEPWGCAPDDARHVEAAYCRSPALALCATALRARATLKEQTNA